MISFIKRKLRRFFVNEWKEAVIEALIVDCIYRNDHENDPYGAIGELISWETKIALDPAVSSDAAALIERGRQERR